MRPLLLTQYYPPEPGTASQKMSELAEHLHQRGHDVTVVTGFPNYPDGVLYEGYRRKLHKKERVNGVRVIRTFLHVTPKRHSFGPQMKNHLSFMLTCIYGSLRAGHHDLIYVYSPPLFLGVSAYFISRLFRAPLVLDVHDLWPKGPIHLGILKNPAIIAMAERLERFVYSKAHCIFFYSDRMRQEVVAGGVPQSKTEVHPLWVDTEFFQPAPPDQAKAIREKYGMDGRLVVMYTGNLGLPQGLDTVMRCARSLKEGGHDQVLFVFVGGGAARDRLHQLQQEYGLDNVLFIPPQPVSAMPAFMSAGDILLTHLDKAPFRLGTVPGKLLTYMSAARPVLAGLEGESADIVTQSQGGVVVEPQNPEAMAQGIMRLADPELRRKMGEAGRRAVVDRYERGNLLEAVDGRLQEIVAGWHSRAATAKSL